MNRAVGTSERKLSVSVSVSAEISAEMSVSVLVSAFLKLSVSADISVHSPAEISALYPTKIPTFCLKFTLFTKYFKILKFSVKLIKKSFK